MSWSEGTRESSLTPLLDNLLVHIYRELRDKKFSSLLHALGVLSQRIIPLLHEIFQQSLLLGQQTSYSRHDNVIWEDVDAIFGTSHHDQSNSSET